jgi:hypothetical protein
MSSVNREGAARDEFFVCRRNLDDGARKSLSGLPADETNLPARFFFFSPVGEKFIGCAAGAWTDSKDLTLRDARAVQNGCI